MYELYHHGVKGMKWGVRRKLQDKKAAKKLAKAQKEWDDNVEKNWHKAYNKAADEAEVAAKEINKKYEKYDFSDLSDPKTKAVHDKYVEEYMKKWDALLQKNYDEMFGKRPE